MANLGNHPGTRVFAYAQALFSEFWTLRAPLIWSIVISLGMFFPAQVKELYVINAEQLAREPGFYLTVTTVEKAYLQLLTVSALVFWLRIVCYQRLNAAQSTSWKGFFALRSRGPVRPRFLSLLICTLPQVVLFFVAVVAFATNGDVGEHAAGFWMLAGVQSVFLLASLGFVLNWTPDFLIRLLGPFLALLTNLLDRLNRLTPFDLYGLGGVALALAVPVVLSLIPPLSGLFILALLLVVFNLPYQPVTFWAGTAVLIVLVIIICADPVGVGPQLGPLGLLSLFACCLVLLTAIFGLIEDRLHIPASPIVVGLGMAFSIFDWNDNHFVHTVEATPVSIPEGAARTDVQLAFEGWLRHRPDYREAVAKGRRYPVYLVAAQGGGLYAAYQSASFLAAVQDLSPDFRDHVFAASGVSGGSVGVTVFAALAGLDEERVQGNPCDGTDAPAAGTKSAGPYLTRTNATLRRDFLSPVGAALLFPDMLARLSPVAIHSADRVRALEQSFADAFRCATGSDALNLPLLENWSAGGHVPLLLLNTIDVDTGRRMVATPLADLGEVATIRDVLACSASSAACPSPTLASGMLLSARFPIVTPAGSVMLPERGASMHPDYWANPEKGLLKARFVDGGYFENSGLDTIADLITELRPLEASRNVVFRVLTFDLTPPPAPDRAYWLGEVASPVRALNSSRSARIEPARNRILNFQGETWVDLISIRLDDREDEFPLGWTLSDHTFQRIACDLFDDRACDAIGRDLYSGKDADPGSPAWENRRRLRLIVNETRYPDLRPPANLAAPGTPKAGNLAR
jgi:hypothetical protein